MARLKVKRKWVYEHGGPLDSVAVADVSGDTLVCDLRNRMVLLNGSGKKIWDEKADFAPLQTCLTESGDYVFILTTDGYVVKMARDAEVEWDAWVDLNPLTMAIRSKGEVAVVGSHKARFHIVNELGKQIRLVHTPEPAVFTKFSGERGGLFVASARGWVGLYDRNFKPWREYNLNRPIATLEVTDLGRKIFLPAREEGLAVIEVADGNLATYDPGFSVTGVGISDRGDLILAVGQGGNVTLLNGEGAVLWRMESEHCWTHCHMSGAGDMFVLASDRGYVADYQVSTVDTKAKDDESFFDYLEV